MESLPLSCASGFLLFCVDVWEALTGRDSEEGSPLRLLRGMRLLLLRNELASWLAEEMFIVVVCFGGGSQVSLRPSSHGATLVVMLLCGSVVARCCGRVQADISSGWYSMICNGRGVRNAVVTLLDGV